MWATESRVSEMQPLYCYDYEHPATVAKRAFDLMARGDESHVHDARALLKQLNERVESPHFVWEHSIAGAFPDVPAYLAGEPEHMWHRTPKPDDRSPLRIWVGLTSTWNIPNYLLRKRGIALAALAMALSEVRPVIVTPFYQLNLLGNSKSQGIISWDLSTSPIVLSELLPSLSDPLLSRYMTRTATFIVNPELQQEPAGYFGSTKPTDLIYYKPDDLYLPVIHASDPLLTDPVAWVKTQLAKYDQQDDN